MQALYNLFIRIVRFLLPLATPFHQKIRYFVQGQKESVVQLQKLTLQKGKTVWMHCASLGEFEQGRPVLEAIKKKYPQYKILLSFFSPSGYEIRKNYEFADIVVYLPLDTPQKASQFIEQACPYLVIFVKYEFWPNFLRLLKEKNIPTILISGIFGRKQAFFKKGNQWVKNWLSAFSHFFVQDDNSVKLLKEIGFHNVTKCGDTRFDRVYDLAKQKIAFPLLEKFGKQCHTLVAGSTWPKDEALLVEYINNNASDTEKFILAPHNINTKQIEKLLQKIEKKSLVFSKATMESIAENQVIIIDSVGILARVYQYANVAYVGGGFTKDGVHNVLEPAVYGIPIIVGSNYQKFKEAIELVAAKACLTITDARSLKKYLQQFLKDKKMTRSTGETALNYIQKNRGATKKIMRYVGEIL